MNYLGDIAEDATIRGSFNTRDAAGAPITLAGTPAISVYKDAGTTESTVGVTLTVDFDSRTGFHVFTIDTSADAFYATGSDYRVVITTGTVDDTSVVGVQVGSFSIENRYVVSGSGLDAAGVRAAIGLASANLDTQLADLPTNSEFNARTLASADYFVVGDYTAPDNASITAILADTNELQTNQGNWLTADVSGLATAANLATVAGYLDTEIAAILADTNELQTNQGNWLTATGFSTHSATDVWAVATRALTDKSGFALLQAFPSNFASLGINASGHVSRVVLCDTTTTNTDMRGTDSANTTTPPAVSAIADGVWDEILSGHVVSGSAGASLATASSGGVDAAVLADAIWDEALSGHATSGTTGKALADALADTNELQGNQSQWLTATGFSTSAEVAVVDVNVDAIKTKTDQLAFTVAGQVDANALSGGGGTNGNGQYQINITAAVGATAVRNVRVSIEGTDTFAYTGTLGTSVLNVDAGDYTLIVTPPAGYEDVANIDVTVGAADEDVAIALVATTTTVSEAPFCTVTLPTIDLTGAPRPSTLVTVKFIKYLTGSTPTAVVVQENVLDTSDTDGIASFTLLRLARYEASYKVLRGETKVVSFDTPDLGSYIVVEPLT